MSPGSCPRGGGLWGAGSKKNFFFKHGHVAYQIDEDDQQNHTGQCKRTGGCYNELEVAFFSTGGGVKGKKIYIC